MEEPLCFVRDNPFFKADGGCRRLIRRAPLVVRATTNSPVEKKMGAEVVADLDYMPTSPNPQDLEYGPGIVEKLKAKFSRLSGLTTKETKRRSPSLDELNNQNDYEPVKPSDPSLLRRHSKSQSDMFVDESRSYTIHRQIPVFQDEPSDAPCISTLRRRFEPAERSRSLPRTRPISADYSSHYQNITIEMPKRVPMHLEETHIEIPQVVSPRAVSPTQEYSQLSQISPPMHFSPSAVSQEISTPPSVQREVVHREREREPEIRKLRVLEVLNHADDEPEFVKVARSLKKSTAPPPDYFESSSGDDTPSLRRHYDETREISYEPSKIVEAPVREEKPKEPLYRPMEVTPAPRKFIIRGEAHIPTLSEKFRIVREVQELPPDPEPVRRASIEQHRVTSPPLPTTHHKAPQGSPPPEEPRPSRTMVQSTHGMQPMEKQIKEEKREEPCHLCEETRQKENTKEGFSEVQRILSKFQVSRNNRGVYEVEEEKPPFSATIVNVHNSNRQTTNRVNVVSISVRSDAPSVISTKNNNSPDISPISTTSAKRPAPSPPEIQPTPQPQPIQQQNQQQEERKSLSSKYFEDKAKRERPYGDDVTELRAELRESSVDDDPIPIISHQEPVQDSEESADEIEDVVQSPGYFPSRPFSLQFPEPMIAGDGNPIRHTLLSLVMEEDIPQLLEAMTEKYNFVFEDLHGSPSTSSIIHPVEMRKIRRQQRQVSSIKFQQENPVVYTYLDEDSQISEHWKEGAFLSYDEYQRMWEEVMEEKEMSIAELERWKAEMSRRLSDDEIHSNYNSITDSTISV